MKRKFLPLLLLIICNVILVLGNLYITRYAFSDLEYVVYSQRTYYKAQAMQRMGNYFYEISKAHSDSSIADYVSSTIMDPSEAHFIMKYNREQGFPTIWIGGNYRFQRYAQYPNLRSIIEAGDSLNDIDKQQVIPFYNALEAYTISNDRSPYVVTAKDGTRYLLTWVIIPQPNTSAKYVYFVITPASTLLDRISDVKDRYVWIFAGGVLLAGAMLVLVPLTVKRFL